MLACAFSPVAFGALAVGAFVYAATATDEGLVRQRLIVGVCSLALAFIPLLGLVASWLLWVKRAWTWLPEEYRVVRHYRGAITPDEAMWRMLIPGFNIYWFIVIEDGLVDALLAMQARLLPNGAGVPIPRAFVMAAFGTMIITPIPPLFALAYGTHQRNVQRAMNQLADATLTRPA